MILLTIVNPCTSQIQKKYSLRYELLKELSKNGTNLIFGSEVGFLPNLKHAEPPIQVSADS